ncbi:MAG: NAD(P)/FAD-dependent oxidoreductase [Bryobacteraceae bacterium]
MAASSVVIIGAGLAGLSCALRLQEKGIEYTLLEGSDRVGGRVHTDVENGFRLDRGFQVLLTAYPQTARTLHYKPLQLQSFRAGALVRSRDYFYALADPMREPGEALSTLLAPVTTFADKLRILRLRQRVCGPSLEQVLAHPETTTLQRLRELQFSDRIIFEFFRPFLGGIFLETDLATSSRKFEFVFRMFSLGYAALPAAGMSAIPQQMAQRLKAGSLRTRSCVISIDSSGVTLTSGERLDCRKIVIATDESEASRLLQRLSRHRTTAVTCLYYSAPQSPVKGPWLVLNGDGSGPINNLCVLTELHRNYAPQGLSLVSVSVIHPAYRSRPDLESSVRDQLTGWYGSQVSRWRHLRTYEIDGALPLQEPPALNPVEKPVKLADCLFWCGDHAGIVSVEGAIASGIRAADAVSGS